MWGAGAGLLGIGAWGAATWFALPKPTEEDNQKYISIDLKTIPQVNGDPTGVPVGKFWLTNTSKGLLALSMICPFTRQPCFFKWVPTNHRFECHCCGSKFDLDGTQIRGIASRNVDRFVIRVSTFSGTHKTSPEGDAISIIGATEIVVDTSKLIRGRGIS
jgi:Rieske Fe-S protein